MWGFLVLSPKRCSERASTQTPSWGGRRGQREGTEHLVTAQSLAALLWRGLGTTGGTGSSRKPKGEPRQYWGGTRLCIPRFRQPWAMLGALGSYRQYWGAPGAR